MRMPNTCAIGTSRTVRIFLCVNVRKSIQVEIFSMLVKTGYRIKQQKRKRRRSIITGQLLWNKRVERWPATAVNTCSEQPKQ